MGPGRTSPSADRVLGGSSRTSKNTWPRPPPCRVMRPSKAHLRMVPTGRPVHRDASTALISTRGSGMDRSIPPRLADVVDVGDEFVAGAEPFAVIAKCLELLMQSRFGGGAAGN